MPGSALAFKKLEKDSRKLRIHEVDSGNVAKHHIRRIKVMSQSGSMIGFVGINRMREIRGILKSRLSYKEGHVLLFGGSGEITNQPFIQNCIFSEENEDIDHRKLLKSIGHEIKVKSSGEGIEITQCSIVGSRTYSLSLEGFSNHTNVYVGEFDSDVLEQHLKRLRSHKTNPNNPDYMFITHFISERALERSKRRMEILERVYGDKELKIPERYKGAVKIVILSRTEGTELSIERIRKEIEEQEQVFLMKRLR
jgi:hypothetical protein